MTLYALDTSVSGFAFEAVDPVASRVRAQPSGSVFTTAVTLEEAVSGWYDYLRKAKQPSAVEKAYDGLVKLTRNFGRLSILPYNLAAIARYEGLLRLKLNVRRNDLRIAAIALVSNAVVVTANVRDFARVPGAVRRRLDAGCPMKRRRGRLSPSPCSPCYFPLASWPVTATRRSPRPPSRGAASSPAR